MSLKKLIVVFGVLCMIASFAYIAGCLSTVPNNTMSSNNATTAPIKVNVVIHKEQQPTEQPPKYYTTPTPTVQTVYNSPNNGPRMPDLPEYKGPLPTPEPSISNPTPRPTI